jgi:hypothetical protein
MKARSMTCSTSLSADVAAWSTANRNNNQLCGAVSGALVGPVVNGAKT